MEKKRERKTKKIEVLCTETQFEKISKKARNFAMSNSEYGLFTMLNSKIEVSIGADPVIEKLRSAVEMMDSGTITKEEFEILKERIIRK